MKKVFILLNLILLFGCKKANNNSNSKLDFTAITVRDNVGMTSIIDIDDWNFNDNFTDQENKLFNINQNNTLRNVISNNIIEVYPNPCNGLVSLSCNIDSNFQVEFRVVKTDFTLIGSYNVNFLTGPNNILFDLRNFVSTNEFIRVYYRIIGANAEYRGHGDIKIVK